MTAKEAYKKLIKSYPNKKAVACTEYDKFFAFQLVPSNYTAKSRVLVGMYTVDKATGKIGFFEPLRMSIEEYRSGKKITDFES